MEKQGIKGDIIRVMRDTFRDVKAYVKTDREGMQFVIGMGVKQGDPLALTYLWYWRRHLGSWSGKNAESRWMGKS